MLLAWSVILCAALLINGCERSAATGPSAQPAQDQSAAALEQIRQLQEKTGQDMAWLTEQVKRQQTMQADQSGNPPLVRDLSAARYYLTLAQTAARAKDDKGLTAALQPLERVVNAMAAELPATLIAQRVDRAVYLIHNQQGIGSKELTAAAPELLAASDATVNGRPAAVVPDVLKDIEAARTAVGKGSAAEALQTLDGVLGRLDHDSMIGVLGRAQSAVRGALQAQGRTAWPVVVAELEELDNILTELAKTVAPQTFEKPAEQGAAEKPAETTPEAGATSAVPGAATSALPATSAVPAPAVAPTVQTPAAQPAAKFAPAKR
jgi:hypothetical protein